MGTVHGATAEVDGMGLSNGFDGRYAVAGTACLSNGKIPQALKPLKMFSLVIPFSHAPLNIDGNVHLLTMLHAADDKNSEHCIVRLVKWTEH